MEQRHALTFSTEIGGIKIEIESDLAPYTERRLYNSDNYYYTKLKEVQNTILQLAEEKKYNDNIWKYLAFKADTGTTVHLYDLSTRYLVSIVSPEEWEQYAQKYVGTFVLNTNGVWSKTDAQK